MSRRQPGTPKSRIRHSPITADTWCAFGLTRPAAEVRVCDDRKWRCDFVWSNGEYTLAVEVHGGMWAGGSHARSPKDFAKGHRCTLNGWHRMEFTPRQVRSGYAAGIVRAFLHGHRIPPDGIVDPEDRRKKR